MGRVPLAALLGVLALTACTGESGSSGTPTASPSTSATSASTAPAESTTPASGTTSPTTSGGPLSPTTELLEWTPVPGPVEDVVTASSTTTITVPAGNKTARIQGPQQATIRAGGRGTISHVLLDEQRAVVVVEDTLAERGDRATVLDLATGATATLDQGSSPRTVPGGAWALGLDTLVHATVSPEGAYCLATVSLESGQGSLGWCAEERHGFRGAVISDIGLSIMGFDDQRPVSCATLLAIDGTDATPFEGVSDCKGWDAARLDDGAVWSEVPKPNRQDSAVFRARVGDAVFDLGPGTTGSLVWCGGAAYFVRDPQTDDEPARLLRFTPDGSLAVVYESASRGNAFLSAPRCGGDALTLTSFGEQGDEQVTAGLS